VEGHRRSLFEVGGQGLEAVEAVFYGCHDWMEGLANMFFVIDEEEGSSRGGDGGCWMETACCRGVDKLGCGAKMVVHKIEPRSQSLYAAA